MDKVFLDILNMSLTASFVIAAVCVARVFLRRAPKVYSYALWAVVLFNLIIPFKFTAPASLNPIKPEPIPQNIIYQAAPRIDSGITVIDNSVSNILPAPDTTHVNSVNPLQIWLAVGALSWAAGIAAMLLYAVITYIRLKRRLRFATKIDGSINENGNIYETDAIRSPFVLGLIRPKIYLPVGLPDGDLAYILPHERTHIKRRDYLIKPLAYITLILHWFNPLVWLAFFLLNKDMEMSCDERVLEEMGKEQDYDSVNANIKAVYSNTLLRLATGRRQIGLSPLAFGEGSAKERIKNVLNFRKPSRVIIIASVALLAIMSVGFAVNHAIDKKFPMQGNNLSDLQTDDIIRRITQITGANASNIMVPSYSSQIQVSSDFDWKSGGTIHLGYNKSGVFGNQNFVSQLRIYPDEDLFFITDSFRIDPPQNLYSLKFFLDALKYLPQEYVRSLTVGQPDMYIISIANGTSDDSQPSAYYDKNGIAVNNNRLVRLDIQPMYQDVDGPGYHGIGADMIHLFYGEANTFKPTYKISSTLRTPYVGDHVAVGKILDALPPLDDAHIQRFYALGTKSEPYSLTVYYEPKTVSADGDVRNIANAPKIEALLFALIDNLDEVTFAFRDTPSGNELDETAYKSSISASRDMIEQYLADNYNLSIAKLQADWNTSVEKLFAPAINAPPANTFKPTYQPTMWVDFTDPGMSNASNTAELDSFPGVEFSATQYEVTATDDKGAITLFTGMPILNVYMADLNGDNLPEICATVLIGSGIGDRRILVYDYANKKTYELSDRMIYDYGLSLENGQLKVTQTDYIGGAIRSVGSMAITSDGLAVYGIDRTKTTPEPSSTALPQPAANLDDAIDIAIVAHNGGKYGRGGDFAAANHVTLKTVESGNFVTSYIMAFYAEYSNDGGVHQTAGSHIPVAITLEKPAFGLVEYWEAQDGSYYLSSIHEKFPSDIWDKVDTQLYVKDQQATCLQKAVAYYAGLPTATAESTLYQAYYQVALKLFDMDAGLNGNITLATSRSSDSILAACRKPSADG